MEKSLGRLVAIVYRKNQIYLNAKLKELNLCSGESVFLRALFTEEGQTQEQLSLALHIDKAATARAVRSLEHKGFVLRKQDEQDRRCNRIYLTGQGRGLQDTVLAIYKSISTRMATLLGKDTYDDLCTGLETIIQSDTQESL